MWNYSDQADVGGSEEGVAYWSGWWERAKKLYKSCMKLFLGFLLVSFCILSAGVSAQEIYRWVDENGRTIHFTDNLLSIPQKFWSKAEKRRFGPANKSTHYLTAISQPVSSPQKIVVPFTRHRNRIIVDGIVNGRSTIKFILDTGSELTVIPRALVKQSVVSIDDSITIPITGIVGTIVAPLVIIDSLKVGKAEVRNLEAVIIKDGPLTGQGLLGGNFLGKFRVGIDYMENQLILERRVGTGK